ncbi:MAG TPA: hypothetical protein VHB21_12505 [Minicystis sp.]|nr:hypothetical protein [Minicystis sp.]
MADRDERLDPRLLAAWREWLGALATDAEAAIAASHVYADLAPEARDAWLDALQEDAPRLDVPKVAVYAPLLAVEADPARRRRIQDAVSDEPISASARATSALRGIARDGSRIVALVVPLYLDFVRVLWCRFVPDEGFAWAHHDGILAARDAPHDGLVVDGVALEATPLTLVVEELAHAVLATSRRGTPMPPSLRPFAGLFDAHLEPDHMP